MDAESNIKNLNFEKVYLYNKNYNIFKQSDRNSRVSKLHLVI